MRGMVGLALAMVGCAGGPTETASIGAFEQVPPPGAGGLTLTGPTTMVSGETVTFEVTAPDLAVGDRIDVGFGTRAGAGFCPFRVQTGGSPCLDVTGDVQQLGTVTAADVGGTVKASLTVPVGHWGQRVHVQAFKLAGYQSATSNVLELALDQPWPILDPRVDALEGDVAGLQGEVATLEGDLSSAEADIAALQGVTGGLDSNYLNTAEPLPFLFSLPGTSEFGPAQDGVAWQWGSFTAYAGAGGVAGSPVVVSTFTFASSQWRVQLEGEWANNYEGGSLPQLPTTIEISSAAPTVQVGSVTLTFSRQAASGMLQVVASSSQPSTYGASFRGMVKIIPRRQGVSGTASQRLAGSVVAGSFQRATGGVITGKDLTNVTAGTYTIFRADVHGAGVVVVKGSGSSHGTCRYTELGTFTDAWNRLGNPKTYNPSGAACPSVSVAVSASELRVTVGAHSYTDYALSVYAFGDLTVF